MPISEFLVYLTCGPFHAGALGAGVLSMELNGATPGGGHDQIKVRGTVNLSGVTLSASLGFASSVNDQFIIIDNDGVEEVATRFAGLANNAELYIGGELFRINYAGGDGNDVVLSRLPTPPLPLLTIQHVPPASVRLLWPTNAVGFTLQFNTNLNTVNWTNALPLPVLVGTNHVVTNRTLGGPQFYQLFKP